MINKLKIKFVSVIMLIVTIMLAVIFALVYYLTASNLEQQSIRMMMSLSGEPGSFGFPTRPNNIDNDNTEDIRLPFCSVVVHNDGTFRVIGGRAEGITDDDSIETIVSLASESDEKMGVLRDYKLRFLKGGAMDERIIFADISAEIAALGSLVRSCALIGAASIVVFLAVSLLLARWVVKPVETAWQQQRQFIADASHELKTPLTVIMTDAELLRESCEEGDQTKFTDSIIIMSQRMKKLVESLLELARADNGVSVMAFEQIDFSKAVSDALLPFEPMFFERELELSNDIDDGIYVNGDKARLCQVVDILLDNALKYAAPNSVVSVELKSQGGWRLLSVASAGEPISREDRKNIFKRFYRVDKSRHDGQSYGLGLSIAENIVKQHKGKIWAESANGINTFFVQLA